MQKKKKLWNEIIVDISEKVIDGKLLKNQNIQIMCPWAVFVIQKVK